MYELGPANGFRDLWDELDALVYAEMLTRAEVEMIRSWIDFRVSHGLLPDLPGSHHESWGGGVLPGVEPLDRQPPPRTLIHPPQGPQSAS
jgi:hypothetical protein